MKSFIENCEQINQIYHVNQNEAIVLLHDFAQVAFRQSGTLANIEDKDAAIVGETFLNLFDLIVDESLFQTLATLGYYFLSRGIEYNPANYRALEKRIIILNMGARTFYKTIAKARRKSVPVYIDFNNWIAFPPIIKYVLLLEYKDIERLQCETRLPYDISMRKQWLDDAVSQGYFNEICMSSDILRWATLLHDDLMKYLSSEIKTGKLYFVD